MRAQTIICGVIGPTGRKGLGNKIEHAEEIKDMVPTLRQVKTIENRNTYKKYKRSNLIANS